MNRHRSPEPSNSLSRFQHGATLIVALVVVVIVTLLATRVSSDYFNLFRNVENQTALQQARIWLTGTEALARQGLLSDLLLDSVVDAGNEGWAKRVESPVENGLLEACLVDLQGRLNLNDLYNNADGSISAAQQRFIRLLQVMDLEQALDQLDAEAVANAVFDWLDADDQVRYPGGAESLYYYQQEPPYRAANQAFSSISELALVQGLSPELAAALTPYVTVWGNGNLNINAMDASLTRQQLDSELANSAEADPVMFRTLNAQGNLQPLGKDAARQIVRHRIEQGGSFADLSFFQQGIFSQANLDLANIGTASEYYLLSAELRSNDREYQMRSVLQRRVGNGGVPEIHTLSREFGQGRFEMSESCVN